VLSVIVLNVIMLSVTMLNVVALSVGMPTTSLHLFLISKACGRFVEQKLMLSCSLRSNLWLHAF
jgi:hypothetical protein